MSDDQPPSPAEIHAAQRFYQRAQELTPRVFAAQAFVAINVAIFIWMIISGVPLLQPNGADLLPWGVQYGPLIVDGEWWRLIAANFLHFGIIHIAFNMVILWRIGPLIERLVGNVGFTAAYLASGLGGSVATLWWSFDVFAAGASGAVFGIFGVMIGFVLRARGDIPKLVRSELLRMGVFFVIANVAIGMSMPGIGNAAHLGGLATGFIAGVIMAQPFDRHTLLGRIPRNLAVASLSAGLVFGAIYLFGDEPTYAALDANRASRAQALVKYDEIIKDLATGHIDMVQAADQLSAQVEPPLRVLAQALSDTPKWPHAHRRAQARTTTARILGAMGRLEATLRARDDEQAAAAIQPFIDAVRDLVSIDTSRLLDPLSPTKRRLTIEEISPRHP